MKTTILALLIIANIASCTEEKSAYLDVVLFGYEHSCIGCASNQESTGVGELIALEFSVCLQHEQSAFGIPNFPGNRLHHEITELERDSCALFPPLENPTDPELNCLDAGKITLETNWEIGLNYWVDYIDDAHTYPDILTYIDSSAQYEPEEDITLTAEGGNDIGEFTSTQKGLEPIVLHSPSVDVDGITVNVPKNLPLDVSWSGGSSDSLAIIIASRWTWVGEETAILGCHVENDGNFTIPEEHMGNLEWANTASLSIEDRTHINMGISDIPTGSITLLSFTSLIIHFDADAEPPIDGPDGSMYEGYVGIQCTDDSNCGGGQCFLDSAFAPFGIGYCSLKNCMEANDCPADANCYINTQIPSIPYVSFCAKKCTEDNDCRVDDGHLCIDNSCIPGLF